MLNLEVSKRKCANSAITAKVSASECGIGLTVWVWLGLTHSQSLTDGNFAALWPTNPILTVWKDLNSQCTLAVQDTGSILRVYFALLKWPQFDIVYLQRERFVLLAIVCNLPDIGHSNNQLLGVSKFNDKQVIHLCIIWKL